MNKYSGSNFDDFLEEEGILEEVSALARKRLAVFQTEEMDANTEQLNQFFDTDNTLGD